MKGQWPPQCLPPIMWSEEAPTVSIERAVAWLGDNKALLAQVKQTLMPFNFFLRLQQLQRKKIKKVPLLHLFIHTSYVVAALCLCEN